MTGEGPHFSSGYDIGDIPDDVFAVEAEKLVAHPFTNALDALDATDVPTVCAITGPAIGGGLELALACDLRVAAEGITVGMPPAKLGLVYSHTGLRRFIDAIGAPRTRELFLVGRRVPADTALAWGLVNEVVRAGGRRGHGAGLGAGARRRTRRSASAATSASSASCSPREGELDPQTEQELIALRQECFASQDMLEGVRAFGEKRAPRWQGRLSG